MMRLIPTWQIKHLAFGALVLSLAACTTAHHRYPASGDAADCLRQADAALSTTARPAKPQITIPLSDKRFDTAEAAIAALIAYRDPVNQFSLRLEGEAIAPEMLETSFGPVTLFWRLTSSFLPTFEAHVSLWLLDGQIVAVRKINDNPRVPPLGEQIAARDYFRSQGFLVPEVVGVDTDQKIMASVFVPGFPSPDPALLRMLRSEGPDAYFQSQGFRPELAHRMNQKLLSVIAAATETIRQNPDQLQRFSRSFRNKAAFPDPNGQGNLIYSAGEWWWIDP